MIYSNYHGLMMLTVKPGSHMPAVRYHCLQLLMNIFFVNYLVELLTAITRDSMMNRVKLNQTRMRVYESCQSRDLG